MGSGWIADKEAGQGRKWTAEEDKEQRGDEPLHQERVPGSSGKGRFPGEGGMGGENESSKISMQTTAGKREMRPLRETPGPSRWPALSTSGEFCGTLRRISEGYSKDRTSCALHLHPPCPYTVTFSDVCGPEGWGRTLFKNLHECFIDF